MQKPKHRNRILHTPVTYGKRNGRKGDTNFKKVNANKSRIERFNGKYKPSAPGDAFHYTSPFEVHHGRKPRTEVSNIVKDGKTYLSDWSEISISAPSKPKIPIYVDHDADGEVTNHMVMAKTKTEEKQANEGQKSPKNKTSVRYPLKFVEKSHNKKSIEGKFQKQIQSAIDGTENTVKTDTGKITHQKFISGPLFQTEKRSRKETE